MSSNSIDKSDGNYGGNDDAFSIEFLNSIRASGVPNHNLVLKVGAPIMMLRNMDQSAGLCNGTRLLVDHLGDRILQATVISGSNIGYKVFIPRIIHLHRRRILISQLLYKEDNFQCLCALR